MVAIADTESCRQAESRQRRSRRCIRPPRTACIGVSGNQLCGGQAISAALDCKATVWQASNQWRPDLRQVALHWLDGSPSAPTPQLGPTCTRLPGRMVDSSCSLPSASNCGSMPDANSPFQYVAWVHMPSEGVGAL